jgi:hypothetical protein
MAFLLAMSASCWFNTLAAAVSGILLSCTGGAIGCLTGLAIEMLGSIAGATLGSVENAAFAMGDSFTFLTTWLKAVLYFGSLRFFSSSGLAILST